MTPCFPIPDPVTPEWLTDVLRKTGSLAQGRVRTVTSSGTDAFNSVTVHLRLNYSDNARPALPTEMVLKRNIPEPWAVEAGAQEVRFYQIAAALEPPPPAVVPCYAAGHDRASGSSYLLLRDLSATHAPPVTREQTVALDGVPPAHAIERVVDALAQHHAAWWGHPLRADEAFGIGYWSRDAERFALYVARRRAAWADLCEKEAGWFPPDLRDLYSTALDGLQEHWERCLLPRFQSHAHLTLVHGDAYFSNFLCPRNAGETYLLDWQSPAVDIGGYDLANLCATFWTPAQRRDEQRETAAMERYLATLRRCGVKGYAWEDLVTDYQAGLIYWLLVPVQDRYDGSPRTYWWPKMQCIAAAFREWNCLYRMSSSISGGSRAILASGKRGPEA